MTSIPVTDIFRFAHILVVAIGLGAAFLADFHALFRLGRRVDDDLMTTLHACHSLVWKALMAMWITGAIMIYIRTGFVFENFSPKLISKVGTVAILTVNALLIGRFVMPMVEECRGKSLMWLPLRQKLGMALVAAISTSSWLLALAMGVSKVLATSGWLVFIATIPVVYILSATLAMVVMYLLHLGGTIGAHRPKTFSNLPAISDRMVAGKELEFE
jgi:hypothetical protein